MHRLLRSVLYTPDLLGSRTNAYASVARNMNALWTYFELVYVLYHN
jgi:hypothetical protein